VRRRRARGASLLEVLVAISLFAIVATGVGVLIVGTLRHTVANQHGTTAVMLAQEMLEDLRGLPYDDIVSDSRAVTVGVTTYTVDAAVDTDMPADGMKQIRVTVTWTGPEGTKSYGVDSILTSVTG
jgi:Tfp pilus assembly protein PilV